MANMCKTALMILGLVLALGALLVAFGGSVQAGDVASPSQDEGDLPLGGNAECDNTNDGGVMETNATYVMIDVDCWHAGHCQVCDEFADYSCSPYNGDPGWCWFSPCPFTDPVPEGNIVTGIKAELRGVSCGGGSMLTEVYVNGTLVGSGTQEGDCTCGHCFPLVISGPTYETGFPGYVYGGANQLGLDIDGETCLSDVHLTLYYRVESSPGPRVSPSVSTPRPLNPAQMSLQYLSVNPQQTTAGQPVTITTNVVNTGDEGGNLNVALKINGQLEESRMVSVGPQGTQPVKFTVTKAQPGTYNVTILDKSGSFTILGAGSSTSSSSGNSGPIVLVIMGVLVLATVVVLVLTRGRHA